MRRREVARRLEQIEAEYLVGLAATGLLMAQLRIDPGYGVGMGWRRRDALRWRSDLEGTMLIRLHAEFEAGLRASWRGPFRQTSQPPMKDLMVAISARKKIPDLWHQEADEVRIYRNSLVHEGREAATPIPIAEACDRLARYVGRLPDDW